MQHPNPKAPLPDDRTRLRGRWFLPVISVLSLLVVILAIRRPGASSDPTAPSDVQASLGAQANAPQRETARPQLRRTGTPPMPAPTAEEVVAAKQSQFARSRLEFARALARRQNVQVPADVERFFAAVESGNWDDIEAAFKKINGGDSSCSWADTRAPDVNKLWPAIIDAYGVAEQVHMWPAQQLLDYGNAVLGALRPGMVYVGGTDDGRWIPELLNDTSDGERHIVITQNGLAAGDYLDYLRLQYDDRFATLSDEDSKSAFAEYVADAQKRFDHDQQFPDEPKQVLSGENLKMVNGKLQVSGQAAVMAINERLLHMLMQKNPDLSFAIQESFPLESTYADARPLGPLMELGVGDGDGQNAFSPDIAAQSLDYWRNTAQEILANPAAADSSSALKSYSHNTAAAANLLAAHGFTVEAQEAYRLASQLWPANPESTGALADLLAADGRQDEARQLLDTFTRQYPDERKKIEKVSAAWSLLFTPSQSAQKAAAHQ